MKLYKNNRKLTEFDCDYCGTAESKPTSEYQRNIRLGRKNFCSRSCSVKYSNKYVKKNRLQMHDISQHAGNKRDAFTPFRYTYRNARKRYKEFNMTLENLADQWVSQKGICPFSGLTLELPDYKRQVHFSIRASLDRIDSSKGYVVGNIQFVSTMINLMKSNLSDQDVYKFRDQLVKNYCPCYQED